MTGTMKRWTGCGARLGQGCGVAVAATAAAALLRWVLGSYLDPMELGDVQPFTTFYVVVLFLSVWRGWRLGLAAAVLGFLTGDWLFLTPRGGLKIVTADGLAHTLIYWLVAAAIIYSIHRSQKAASALAAANESLRQSEERFRAIFDKAAVGIMEVDTGGRLVAANERVCQILGYRSEELAGKTVHELTAPEDHPRSDELNAELLAGKRTCLDYEKRYLKRDGCPLWVHVTASAICDPAGRQVRFIGTMEDISERKRAEQGLRQAKEEWERTFDSVPDLIAIIDGAHRITRVNQAMARRVGRTPQQCIGLACYQCIHGVSCAPGYCPHALTLADGRIHSSEVHEDRLGGDFHVTTTPLLDEQGRMIGAVHVSRDVTQRKQMETALRFQLLLTRSIADAAAVCIFVTDEQGRVTFMNPEAEKVFGFSQEELQGKLMHDAIHHHYPDGRPFPQSECPIGKVYRSGQATRSYEESFFRKDGSTVPVVCSNAALLLEGKVAGAVLVAQDITERKRAEAALREAKEQLALANVGLERKVRERTARLQETVAELEDFSYTITHDMRAPLRAMRTFGDIVMEEYGDSLHAGCRDYLRRITESAGRMDRLITDALQYSGVLRQRIPLEPVDTGALLRGILESYPQFQAPRALIHVVNDLPAVLGNKAAMTQCFSNLLGNAVKFVQPGKTPEVRVCAELRNAEGTIRPASGFVRLWFEDNGIGIAREYYGKIWKMFEQLNTSYEGTGIGLALVRKVVLRMGGQVGVESQPGHGSRFWVDLRPAAVGQVCRQE
jgi:PAS domain S-box-containing protein